MHFSLEFWGNFSPAFPFLKVLVACYFLDHSFLTEEKSLSDILCSELCKGVAEHKHATVSAIEMYSTKIPPLTTPKKTKMQGYSNQCHMQEVTFKFLLI